VLTVTLGLVAGCGGGTEEPAEGGAVSGFRENNPDGLHGAVLPSPYTLPEMTLTDASGDSYELRAETTRPLTLVYFGYTHCPDICPATLIDIASALVRLPQSDREKVGLLLITSDPARDDPGTIRRYLDRFDPDFEGATGRLTDIKAVGEALGVAIEKGDRLPTGGYDVGHGSQVVGVLPDGSAPLVWTHGTSPQEYAEDFERVLADGVPAPEGEAGS
jgi:protein SCO1/2